MDKDYSNNERKPDATTSWATLTDYQKGNLICTIPIDRMEHPTVNQVSAIS